MKTRHTQFGKTQTPNKPILIFDTTLRDGEQSPGASMTIDEKLKIAHQLKKLGVDIIEAGFPVISSGDFNAVKRIAEEVRGPTICALARCCDQDIIAAANAIMSAEKARIHVFIATSEIHMLHKLGMSRKQVVERAVKAVKKASSYCRDVEFSAEDATRSDPDFLVQIFSAVIDAGASTINVPDTVGYSTPEEYAALIDKIQNEVTGIEHVTISVHCHNDLGLATANSLAAIKSGARQVECTINGIGERSGNAALEEVVMGLKTRHDTFSESTRICTTELLDTSRLVAEVTGIAVQHNKAIVGKNAFAHEAGIHQHGMIANRETYEIMRPQDVGFVSSDLVIGKHSGRHAIRQWLDDKDMSMSDGQVTQFSARVKAFTDQRKSISESELLRLLSEMPAFSAAPKNQKSVGK